MKPKEKPTFIYNVDDLFKYFLYGSETKLYISNLLNPEIISLLSDYLDKNIKIIYFDHLELKEEGFTDLKKNGTEKFLLNKNLEIYKQKYYYYSKGNKKYKTTKLDMYIDKYCNYTKSIINYPLIQGQIFQTSYGNIAELLNETEKINITRQTVFNHQRIALKTFLPSEEAKIWDAILKLDIKFSGYYHYDEEFIKINKEVYVRLSLIDAQTMIIINDILIHKKEFDKNYIKKFFKQSLEELPLECIITDGHRSYPEIIDELGAKHQLCQFHIMKNLMQPLNNKIRSLKRTIESSETKIDQKNAKINKLADEYPYKQGRPPKDDKKAQDNISQRKKLGTDIRQLNDNITKFNKELRNLDIYKEKIKVILRVKTLKTAINKLNKLLKEKDLPDFIDKFVKNLLKKIDRAVQFVNDSNIPKTNNLIELFYKVTFPGKIKRIYRTYEGAMNRIRLNNIRWMKRNVLEKYEKI